MSNPLYDYAPIKLDVIEYLHKGLHAIQFSVKKVNNLNKLLLQGSREIRAI